MGEIVNLRQYRKAKARAENDEQAAANRLQFGRRKEDKELQRQIDELRTRNLDGHKRNDDGTEA